MICINVEEYCHQCLDFSPDVVKPQRVIMENGEQTHTDTIIQCEHRKRCSSIERYLRQQMKDGASG